MECMERFKRSKMCGLSGELYENLQIFVDLTQFQKFLRRFGAFLRLKTLELRWRHIKIQMFLKCFWLLRKPSDQKNIFIDERFDYIWILCLNLKIFITLLAKISLWSVWRDLREAKCVNSGELYENLQNFVDLTQFQKFLRRYGAFLKLKTLELRSGDT